MNDSFNIHKMRKAALLLAITALQCLMITVYGIYSTCFAAQAIRQTSGDAAISTGESMLSMVIIRAVSAGDLQKLRAMHIDIVRVRPDPGQSADKKSLTESLIIEAVVPKTILPKLKAMGFEVSEIPPK